MAFRNKYTQNNAEPPNQPNVDEPQHSNERQKPAPQTKRTHIRHTKTKKSSKTETRNKRLRRWYILWTREVWKDKTKKKMHCFTGAWPRPNALLFRLFHRLSVIRAVRRYETLHSGLNEIIVHIYICVSYYKCVFIVWFEVHDLTASADRPARNRPRKVQCAH